MIDQANKLRDMIQAKSVQIVPSRSLSARVITITSGKGGVGKTNFAVNLAIYLSKIGKRVTVLDADFGLSNVEILLGVIPKYSLADVITGKSSIGEIITEGPMGVQFVSGGSGLNELANITNRQMSYIIEKFAYLDTISDFILIDTGAGISNSVINFIKASDEAVIVTTPEPTSITDAYSLIKTVNEETDRLPKFKMVINRVDDLKEGSNIFEKLEKVANRFLGVNIEYLGSIPYDDNLVKAVKKQQPAIIYFPNCTFSKSMGEIADKLLDIPAKQGHESGIKLFMKRLSNIFGNEQTTGR